jgi:hypothetical protein
VAVEIGNDLSLLLCLAKVVVGIVRFLLLLFPVEEIEPDGFVVWLIPLLLLFTLLLFRAGYCF